MSILRVGVTTDTVDVRTTCGVVLFLVVHGRRETKDLGNRFVKGVLGGEVNRPVTESLSSGSRDSRGLADVPETGDRERLCLRGLRPLGMWDGTWWCRGTDEVCRDWRVLSPWFRQEFPG